MVRCPHPSKTTWRSTETLNAEEPLPSLNKSYQRKVHYVQRNINPTSWKCYCCAAHSLVIPSEALTAAFICWSWLGRSALWPASEALSASLFPCRTHLQACSNRRAKIKLDTPTYVAMSLLYPAPALLQPFLHFPRSPPRLSDSHSSRAQICCGVEHDHNEDGHKKKKDHNR